MGREADRNGHEKTASRKEINNKERGGDKHTQKTVIEKWMEKRGKRTD